MAGRIGQTAALVTAFITRASSYDVRSHGYFDAKATRIRGSRRLDPNSLHQPDTEMPAREPYMCAAPVFVMPRARESRASFKKCCRQRAYASP